MTKDQNIANSIMKLFGKINVPMSAEADLQLALDMNRWLATIISGEMIVSKKPEKEDGETDKQE